MASPLGQGQLQQSTSQAQDQSRRYHLESLKQSVRQCYPDLLQRPHFLPHVYMHRVKHDTVQVAGVDVSVPQLPSAAVSRPLVETDVRDDRAQQHTLFCLRQMAEKQGKAKFVMSQLGFGDYLAYPVYTAADTQLPTPSGLKNEKLEQGDFDVLIIDRQYGLLAGEIKSVGIRAPEQGLSQQQLEDEVLQTLRKMMRMDTKSKQKTTCKPVSQLAKARKVLQHIVSDLQPDRPRVGVTLILPYVSSHLLRTVLDSNPDLKEALCRDLGLELTADPVPHCLCSDQMSDRNKPFDVTDDVLTNLGRWWSQCMSGAGPDPAMTDNLYEDLVARFAGKATIVRIFLASEPRSEKTDMRTAGQFVSEVGDRLSAVALYIYQVKLISHAPDLAYLVGPPGTGKTLTAVVMALEWLQQKQPVHILSGHPTSRAAAHHIKQQLEETLGIQAASQVHIHLVDWSNKDVFAAVADLVKTLTATATNGQVCIIADEASDISDGLSVLYQQLTSHPARFRVRLWATSLYRRQAPRCLQDSVHLMTVPLRCPPCVVREVEQADYIKSKDVPGYTTPSAPLPSDGPPILYVRHEYPSHKARYTWDCQTCGQKVGRVLTDRLHVGQASVSPSATAATSATGTTATTSTGVGGNPSSSSSSSAPALRYRDVFVLSWRDLHDDGVVRGLRQAGVPVRVVGKGDDVADVATMGGEDSVIATGCDNVKGLERKVVVWMGAVEAKGKWEDDVWVETVQAKVGVNNVWMGTVPVKVSTIVDNVSGRLLAMSRTTAQLIWVQDATTPANHSTDDDATADRDDTPISPATPPSSQFTTPTTTSTTTTTTTTF